MPALHNRRQASGRSSPSWLPVVAFGTLGPSLPSLAGAEATGGEVLLACGLLVAVLLAASVYLYLRRQRKSRASEERYRSLMDDVLGSSSVALIILDVSRRVVWINHATESLFGLDRGELLGKDAKWLLRERLQHLFEDPPGFAHKVLASYEDNARVECFECHVVAAPGREDRWVEHRSQPLHSGRYAGGRIEQYLDITHHRRIEAELEQSRHMLQLVLDTIPVRVFWKDRDSTYLGCNRQCAKDAGLDHPEQILGKNDFVLAWRQQAELYRGDDREVIRSGTPKMDYEEPQNWPDGTKRWLRTSKIPLRTPRGDIIGMLGCYEDITERKLAEEERTRLWTAVTNVAACVVILDAAGLIEYVNPAFERITGFSRNEAMGRDTRFIMSPALDESFHRKLWETLGRGEVWRGQLPSRKKDGSSFEQEGTISPIFSDAGEIINFVAVMQDMTQERALEAQLRQAQKMEAIGQLAGGVAHDFNNILTTILGNLELALSDLTSSLPADHAVLASLRAVEQGARRAATLTRQLLAFSRQQVSQSETIDLNGTLSEMEGMLRRLLPESVHMEIALGGGLPAILIGSGQIEQVVLNLVVNARDAMPNGGTLAIETLHADFDQTYARENPEATAGPHVLLVVRDTGVGMDRATMSRIFEPFFTTKPPGRGTGLGLSTVYGIVKQAGGHIRVESEPGRGSCFRVCLPAVSERPARETIEPDERGGLQGMETILLCEDDDSIRQVTELFLRGSGYDVLSAGSGSAALALSAE
ncbi:MAG: PAS domain S-box protein, partial [Planctomycetota bacterium]